MCGGGQAATITAPDTGAYDRMAQAQMDAIRFAQEGSVKVKQQELQTAMSAQQATLAQLKEVTTQRANDTAAQAMRLASLIGTPPPEKTAAAPVTAASTGKRAKGKSALRIERATASSAAVGAGLNIT